MSTMKKKKGRKKGRNKSEFNVKKKKTILQFSCTEILVVGRITPWFCYRFGIFFPNTAKFSMQIYFPLQSLHYTDLSTYDEQIFSCR